MHVQTVAVFLSRVLNAKFLHRMHPGSKETEANAHSFNIEMHFESTDRPEIFYTRRMLKNYMKNVPRIFVFYVFEYSVYACNVNALFIQRTSWRCNIYAFCTSLQ